MSDSNAYKVVVPFKVCYYLQFFFLSAVVLEIRLQVLCISLVLSEGSSLIIYQYSKYD